jgi:AraC-like DNA-binding protein
MPGSVASPVAVHERLGLSLYSVNLSSYASLGLRRTQRKYWIASYVQSGALETRTGSHRYAVEPGDLMVHPPFVPFSEIATRPGTHYWFEFELRVDPQIELLRLLPVSYVVRLGDPKRYEATFLRLLATWQRPPTRVRDIATTALACELVAQVLESWEHAGAPARPQTGKAPQDRFREVIQHMMNHFSKKLSRSQLARIAGLHPSYFDRAFRAAYGVPPLELLRDLRLRRAQELVESSDETLGTIAALTGLGDAAYLSRVFRARFGCTPGQHRSNVRSALTGYMARSSAVKPARAG